MAAHGYAHSMPDCQQINMHCKVYMSGKLTLLKIKLPALLVDPFTLLVYSCLMVDQRLIDYAPSAVLKGD